MKTNSKRKSKQKFQSKIENWVKRMDFHQSKIYIYHPIYCVHIQHLSSNRGKAHKLQLNSYTKQAQHIDIYKLWLVDILLYCNFKTRSFTWKERESVCVFMYCADDGKTARWLLNIFSYISHDFHSHTHTHTISWIIYNVYVCLYITWLDCLHECHKCMRTFHIFISISYMFYSNNNISIMYVEYIIYSPDMWTETFSSVLFFRFDSLQRSSGAAAAAAVPSNCITAYIYPSISFAEIITTTMQKQHQHQHKNGKYKRNEIKMMVYAIFRNRVNLGKN